MQITKTEVLKQAGINWTSAKISETPTGIRVTQRIGHRPLGRADLAKALDSKGYDWRIPFTCPSTFKVTGSNVALTTITAGKKSDIRIKTRSFMYDVTMFDKAKPPVEGEEEEIQADIIDKNLLSEFDVFDQYLSPNAVLELISGMIVHITDISPINGVLIHHVHDGNMSKWISYQELRENAYAWIEPTSVKIPPCNLSK